jgi:hypothetical protein
MGGAIDTEGLAQHGKASRKLVVAAEPGVDVDRRDLGRGTLLLKGTDDPVDGLTRKRRDILAEVDSDVDCSIRLVCGQSRTGHLPQHIPDDGVKPAPVAPALSVGTCIAPDHLLAGEVVTEPESAVFSDHAVDRPIAARSGRTSRRGALSPAQRRVRRYAAARARHVPWPRVGRHRSKYHRYRLGPPPPGPPRTSKAVPVESSKPHKS